jgi:hypothetical protein
LGLAPIVVVIAVILVMMAMDEHDAVMILVMMTDGHDVVMVLVMMTDHDNLVMIPIAISVVVAVADADGYAVFRNYHRLVACRGRSQCGRTQDCERTRDKYQLMHVVFLHLGDVAVLCRRPNVLSLSTTGQERRRVVVCSWALANHRSRIGFEMNAHSESFERPLSALLLGSESNSARGGDKGWE